MISHQKRPVDINGDSQKRLNRYLETYWNQKRPTEETCLILFLASPRPRAHLQMLSFKTQAAHLQSFKTLAVDGMKCRWVIWVNSIRSIVSKGRTKSFYCKIRELAGYVLYINCVWSFEAHILDFTCKDREISRPWSILGILGPFMFCAFLFGHPFGGRDTVNNMNDSRRDPNIKRDLIVTSKKTFTKDLQKRPSKKTFKKDTLDRISWNSIEHFKAKETYTRELQKEACK